MSRKGVSQLMWIVGTTVLVMIFIALIYSIVSGGLNEGMKLALSLKDVVP